MFRPSTVTLAAVAALSLGAIAAPAIAQVGVYVATPAPPVYVAPVPAPPLVVTPSPAPPPVVYYGYGRGMGDRDRDGVPNRYDRDRDGDGVGNRWDRKDSNPRRY
jgi:hypothetical protein